MELKKNETVAERDLVIGVKRGRWRSEPGIESSDKEFEKIKYKIVERDQHRCKKCGAEISGLEVHHKNGDHSDNRAMNLETRCQLCHAPSHVGFFRKNGTIIHSFVAQTDLSALYRAIAVAISMGGEWAEKGRKLHNELLKSAAPVREIFGTSSPSDFGNAFLVLNDDEYENRAVPLDGVRVIFDPDSLSSFAARVRKNYTIDPSMWGSIYDEYMTQRKLPEDEDD